MAGVALSCFGLSPAEFYDLCPVEFDFALRDYELKIVQKERFELEKMRLQTVALINVHLKNPITNPKLYMPFEWDVIEIEVPTEEEWQEWDEIVKKVREAKKVPLKVHNLKQYGL